MGSLLAWFFAAFVAAGSFAFIYRIKSEQIAELKAQIAELKAQNARHEERHEKDAELIEILRGESADLRGKLNYYVGLVNKPVEDAKLKRQVKDINHPPEDSHDRRNEPAEADWSNDEEDGNE